MGPVGRKKEIKSGYGEEQSHVKEMDKVRRRRGKQSGEGDGRKEYITQINNDGRILTNQRVHRLNKSQTVVVVIGIMVGTAIFLYGLYRFEH